MNIVSLKILSSPSRFGNTAVQMGGLLQNSYNRLSPMEQQAFVRLGTQHHSGQPFTLEVAAQQLQAIVILPLLKKLMNMGLITQHR